MDFPEPRLPSTKTLSLLSRMSATPGLKCMSRAKRSYEWLNPSALVTAKGLAVVTGIIRP